MMGDAARTRQASVRYRYAAAMSAPPSAASSARAATRAPAAWRRSGRHRGQLSGAGRVLSPARPSSPRWACAPRRRPDRPDARRRRVVAVPALALTRRLRRPSLASPTMSELRFPGGTSTGRAQHRTTHKSRPFSSCAQRPTSSRSQSSVLHVHAWRARLRAEGYEFVRSPPRLEDRQLRVMLGSRLPITAASVRRFTGVWPRALRSARLDREGSAIEVHAVHVPNGSTNGWVKIDHLHAIRRGLQPPHPRPQILCGDFNTPQSETGGQLTTFGQTLSGRPRERPPSPRAFTAERPGTPLPGTKASAPCSKDFHATATCPTPSTAAIRPPSKQPGFRAAPSRSAAGDWTTSLPLPPSTSCPAGTSTSGDTTDSATTPPSKPISASPNPKPSAPAQAPAHTALTSDATNLAATLGC